MSDYAKMRITQPAEADLRNIKMHTAHLWGRSQSIKYLHHLHKKCLDLLTFPYSGIERLDTGLNIRSITVKEHIVFYRLEKDRISVLRIMHQNMNLTNITAIKTEMNEDTTSNNKDYRQYFGALKDKLQDGFEFIQKIRKEWE